MMDFKTEIEQHFKEAITRHRLHVLPLDQSEVLLVGNGFALSVSYDREEVGVGYVEPIGKGNYVFLSLRRLEMERFLPEDRKLYGSPANAIDERVRASLRVIASGLTNRCADILSGNKTWLSALRKKDPVSWKGQPVNARLSAALLPVLSSSP